jgi:hypothetical protein
MEDQQQQQQQTALRHPAGGRSGQLRAGGDPSC